MTLSLMLSCLWALVATVVALLPSRFHWPAAWALIGSGIPLLGLVTYQNGPVVGLLVLAGGVSVLRWPVIRLLQRLNLLSSPDRSKPAEQGETG